VDRDATELATDDLGLPDVAARANLDPELPHVGADLACASDRIDLIREAGKEAVASVIDLLAVVALQSLSDYLVVTIE
jgi:hypothetical protein